MRFDRRDFLRAVRTEEIYVAVEAGRLVRVLPDLESGEVPVFLAYPEELRQTRRVAVFRDFVLEEIQDYRRRQSEALLV